MKIKADKEKQAFSAVDLALKKRALAEALMEESEKLMAEARRLLEEDRRGE